MKSSGRKISFLIDSRELELLKEACEHGADADRNLEAAVPENGQYSISFSYEELYDKIKALLNISDSLKNKALDLQKGQRKSQNLRFFQKFATRVKITA